MVHELGHFIDAETKLQLPRNTATTQQRSFDFYSKRTSGDTLEKFADEFPRAGYPDDAIFKRDKWRRVYTGRYYGGADQGTEIFSMGMQFIYEDAIGFAQSDPEHFEFTVNAMRGIVP